MFDWLLDNSVHLMGGLVGLGVYQAKIFARIRVIETQIVHLEHCIHKLERRVD